MSISTAAVNWNLAEYNARPAVRVQTVRAIDALACGPRIRELAQQAHAAAAQGDWTTADALRAEAEALIDAELPPVIETFPLPEPTKNPILDAAIDSLETQADEAEALLATYAAQGRRNSPGADELRYQRSIRDLSRKAADLLKAEGLPTRSRGGWLVTSGTSVYVVSDDTPRTCDCRAGQTGLRCKHKLAVEAVARVSAVVGRKAA